MKKIVIDAYRGGEDIGINSNGIIEKAFNLEISKYIYDRLKDLGATVSLTRNTDDTIDNNTRINKIKSFYGSDADVVVISNALHTEEDGATIVYALRNSDTLSSLIANELNKTNQAVDRYYQRRLPSDTSKDYNQLIRDTANNETLIIYYGNANNESEADILKNDLEDLGEAVVIAIANYLGLNYIYKNGEYYTVKSGD